MASQPDQAALQAAEPSCPMAPLLTLLTRPWTLHILWNLSTRGPMRFGALRREIAGISPRLLTVRLRDLEAQGFVQRTALGGKLPQVTYSPTRRLAEMNGVMEHLERLNEKWQAEHPQPERVEAEPPARSVAHAGR